MCYETVMNSNKSKPKKQTSKRVSWKEQHTMSQDKPQSRTEKISGKPHTSQPKEPSTMSENKPQSNTEKTPSKLKSSQPKGPSTISQNRPQNQIHKEEQKSSPKPQSSQPQQQHIKENTLLQVLPDTHGERTCSDQDYVRLIASDNSMLCRTIHKWQQSYNLDVTDLKEKALRLIKGDFRDLYGDLDPEEQEKIEREIARLQRERTELLMGAIGIMAESPTPTENTT